ncbi:MAG: arsenate reductase ArsC [Gemmatimonadales bacterium]|nr:arsenate reductase ArsC [Gemmatimonadales bacterium]MDZ4390399.1 arsenate reductase ArsC [Gemmatimonadales bacterium]
MTVRPAAPLRVLVLCTANSARSQLAEALLAHLGGDLIVAASAGSEPGAMVHPLAVAVLAERGIVWQGKRPKGIEEVRDGSWDLVITVCDAARDACPVLPGATMVHWGLADPARADPADQREAFRRTAEQLDRRVQRLLALPLATMNGATLGAAAAAIHLQE